jgi:primary-amine oxidase
VFTQAGTILVRIGATGIDSVQGLDLQNSSRPESPERHGAEVAPGLRAINHDHYFSLRLDLDIDGRVNRFIRERLIVTTSDAGGLQRSFWEAVPEAVEVETALTSSGVPEIWRVENPHVTVPPNQRPAYQVEGCGPVSLLRTDDWAQRRAAFSGSDLWVTRQRVGELFAAGPYPNQSRGGDGLAAYVDDEPILSADLVAWCTIGIRHVTRPEDWPVLTTIWREIALRPYGFFSRNPAVGVRREFLDTTP